MRCEHKEEAKRTLLRCHTILLAVAANMSWWAFAKSISVHWIARRSSIGMSKSIIPYWSLCRCERGDADTHALPWTHRHSNHFDAYLPSLQFSRPLLPPISGRMCVWFIIEPISREIFLANHIRTEQEIENVRHVDGKAYQSDTRWRQRLAEYLQPIWKICRLDYFFFSSPILDVSNARCFQYW